MAERLKPVSDIIGEVAVPRRQYQDASSAMEIAAAKEHVDRVIVSEVHHVVDLRQI
jgi:hypothetical protein